MAPAVLLLHNIEGRHFGQDDIEQAATLQVDEPLAGVWRHHNLVQFHLNAFAAHNLDAVGHTLQCLESLVLNLEIQLRGKANATHHAQRVVAERDAGLQRRGYNAILQVGQSVERVYEFAETVLVQADGHRIDGEVATVLVVFQRPVLDDGLA